jgi:acetylornithine/succinyldiaminopimelate/putrescine aminotransferase
VEIKIGIQHVAREVHVESDMTADEVEKALTAALADGGMLTLLDDKGRKVLIPAAGIAYLELGAENQRRVGFGAL